MTDLVNHPPHYVTAAGIEAIDVIEIYGLAESFHLGNAMKYMLRAGRKGHALQDLRKADWYLTRYRDYEARTGCGEVIASEQALEKYTPEDVCAAFDLHGSQAAAVRHVLESAAFYSHDFIEKIGLARIALGIAISDAEMTRPRKPAAPPDWDGALSG